MVCGNSTFGRISRQQFRAVGGTVPMTPTCYKGVLDVPSRLVIFAPTEA